MIASPLEYLLWFISYQYMLQRDRYQLIFSNKYSFVPTLKPPDIDWKLASEYQWRANGPCAAPLLSSPLGWLCSPLGPFVGIILLHSPLIQTHLSTAHGMLGLVSFFFVMVKWKSWGLQGPARLCPSWLREIISFYFKFKITNSDKYFQHVYH